MDAKNFINNTSFISTFPILRKWTRLICPQDQDDGIDGSFSIIIIIIKYNITTYFLPASAQHM